MPKAMSYTKGSIIFFSGDKDERIFILQKGFIVLTSTEAETGQTVDERRDSKGIEGLQWSLTANVGVGVRIYKGLSFYAEPGFTWYIPNNVHPQPISLRTKSPYNFSIKTGLRVQI